MKPTRLVVAAMFIVALAVAAASAETQVAAQFDYFTASGGVWMQPFYPNYVIAQTFVATISGTVHSVDATVQRNFSGDPSGVPISFEIRSVYDSGWNGWQPDFAVAALSTGSVSADDPLLNDWFINWVNVPMTAYELVAGQRYAVVATAHGSYGATEGYDWYANGFDGSAYPDGNLLVGYAGDPILANQEYDLPFRINVTVAPPSALAISDALVVARGATYRVTVQITNPDTTTAHDVTLTAATLNGTDTHLLLPLEYGTIKPGESKKCTLQFKDVGPGDQDLLIQGTSSLGAFFRTQTVSVPE